MITRRAVLGVVVLAMAALCGCGGGPEPVGVPPPSLPTYSEIAERFNTRVARLNRLWSRVNLTLHSPREGGGVSVDRAEGHLQLELPDRTALSVTKLGETYFYFGSDGEGYWWLDLSDPDRKVALYGRHEEATPDLVAELGLPVHPRELLDLFAITPLPARRPGEAVEPGRVAWDAARGLITVETEGMWGVRTLWLDPVLLAPQGVELRDGGGNVRASCDMGRYVSVRVVGEGRVPPKVASQYRVQMPSSGASLTLELYGAVNREISPRAFDFAGLVEAYGIDDAVLLDQASGAHE